jgi:hypothetical protein
MIRDPRHGLSAIILHTTMKIGWIRPHEMCEHHGGGGGGGGVAVKEGVARTPLSMKKKLKARYKISKVYS